MADKYKATNNLKSDSTKNVKLLRNLPNRKINIKNPDGIYENNINSSNKLNHRKFMNPLFNPFTNFNNMSSEINDFEDNDHFENNNENIENNDNESKKNTKKEKQQNNKNDKKKSSNNSKKASGKSNNKKTSGAKNLGKKKVNITQMIGKKYVIVGAAIVFFFIIIMTSIVSAKEYGNLELTNSSESISSKDSKKVCTIEQIDSNLIYVGDSSIVSIQTVATSANSTFIANDTNNYEWFSSTGKAEIEKILEEKKNAIFVFSIGLNDLDKVDDYILSYKDLKSKYPDNQFYILELESENVNADDLKYFNDKMELNFANYISKEEIEEKIVSEDENNAETGEDSESGTEEDVADDSEKEYLTDGTIHSGIVNYISDDGKAMCGGGSGETLPALEEVGNWYIENVGLYSQSKTFANPFVSYGARADCTGFVAVYMSYVAGVEIPISYSGAMIYPNGDWAQKAKEAGWIPYSSDEVGTLEPGDVMVAHAGILYSDKGEHAEVYIDESHTFGWGDAWKTYPRNNAVKTSKESDGHVHFRAYNDYITVYRYEG